MPLKVAVMTDVPSVSAEDNPPESIVATEGVADDQMD